MGTKKDPSKPGVVYVVTDNREPERVRYVGRTVRGLRERTWKHWSDAKKSHNAFQNWLRSRMDRKEDVVFTEISWHPNVQELNKAEIEAIAYYRSIGQADLNLTAGGDGGLGAPWTEERRRNHFNSLQRGEDRFNSLLTEEIVREIRERACREPINASDEARRVGVNQATMNDMLRNITWRDPNYDPSKRKYIERKGENAGNARLTRNQVDEIREGRTKVYESCRVIGERYGVSKDMIRLILINKNWYDPDFDTSKILWRNK